MNESLKAEDIIRQYGLKLTQPRLKVLRLLLSRQEVLTADEIYEALVKEGARVDKVNFCGGDLMQWGLNRKALKLHRDAL